MEVETIEKQVAVLMQGSDYGDQQIKEMMTRELRQRLTEAAKEGRPLEVYCGYDVTASDLHLGNTITMHKLRQFQDFGHHVTFVIGTFTTLIGDPSDRDEARGSVPPMEQIEKNARNFADQAFKVLDRKKTTVRFNGEWLSKMTFADVIKGASYFTVQQMLARDRRRNRRDANKPLGLHELLYARAQGYDAVNLHADVQIGGSAQLFNLMAVRRLQEAFGQKPQVGITFPILPGTDGSEKMSKSLGNYIGVTEPAEQQYGKIMSIPDKLILQYFELLTNISPEELAEFKQAMAGNKVNPMELKKEAPEEIEEIKITPELLQKIQARLFKEEGSVVSGREVGKPETEEWFVPIPLLLTEIGLAKSRSDARRLIKQESVRIDGKTVYEDYAEHGFTIKIGSVINVGRRWVKLG